MYTVYSVFWIIVGVEKRVCNLWTTTYTFCYWIFTYYLKWLMKVLTLTGCHRFLQAFGPFPQPPVWPWEVQVLLVFHHPHAKNKKNLSHISVNRTYIDWNIRRLKARMCVSDIGAECFLCPASTPTSWLWCSSSIQDLIHFKSLINIAKTI